MHAQALSRPRHGQAVEALALGIGRMEGVEAFGHYDEAIGIRDNELHDSEIGGRGPPYTVLAESNPRMAASHGDAVPIEALL